MNTNEIFIKHSGTEEYLIGVLDHEAFCNAIPDILSAQWQTREPTKEDGDENGMVEVWATDWITPYTDTVAWNETKGMAWRKIIPPTQNK